MKFKTVQLPVKEIFNKTLVGDNLYFDIPNRQCVVCLRLIGGYQFTENRTMVVVEICDHSEEKGGK